MHTAADAPSRGARPWPVLGGALAMFALTVWTFYPGWLSWDSAYQWYQVRSGEWNNVHPVIMTLLWSVTDRMWPGPGGYFLLQLAMYWSGLAVLAIALFARTPARIATLVLLGVFPPVFALVPHLWKDVGMLAAAIWTVALLAHDLRTPRRSLRVAALATLTIACAYRHNALPLALPLLWHLAGREPALATRPRRAAATALLLAAVAIVASLPNRLPGVERRDLWPATTIWDIAAVSIDTGTLLLPPELIKPSLTLAELEAHFVPYANVPIFGTGKVADSVSAPLTPAQDAAVDAAWLGLWTDHTGAYLAHRVRLTWLLAGMDRAVRPSHQVVQPGIVPLLDNPAVAAREPALQRGWSAAIDRLVRTPVFSLAPYLLAIVVLALLPARRRHPLTWPVALSALLYLAPLPLVAPSAEWRYLAWPVFVAPLLLALYLAPRNAVASSRR